jgi:hypothetical protein
MSVAPSNSPGQPTLGRLLIERAFSRPPRHMVDRDLIQALEGAHRADVAKGGATASRVDVHA